MNKNIFTITTCVFSFVLCNSVLTAGWANENQPTSLPPKSSPQNISPQTQVKKISFQAIAQFVQGNAILKTSETETSKILYGTPIYDDQHFTTENDSILKLVSKSGCIFTIYGEGQSAAPQEEKPWRIVSQALRVICKGNLKSEKYMFHGVEFQTQGEALLDKSGKILILSGSSSSREQNLKAQKIYQYSNSSFVNQESTSENIYAWNEKFKAPQESLKLTKPQPAKLPENRLQFHVDFGPAIVIHANSLLNHYDYNTGGAPRLEYVRKRANDSAYIYGMTVTETKRKGENYTQEYTSDQITSFILDFGYRPNFHKWNSSFIKAGIMWERNEMEVNTSPCNYQYSNNCQSAYHERRRLDYFGINLSVGYEALMRPAFLSGFGIYSAVSLNLLQTIHSTTDANVDGNYSRTNVTVPDAATNEHGLISIVNAQLNLGILYEF